MAFCPNCGAPAEGRFCQKCGTPLGSAAPPPPPYTPLETVPSPSGATASGLADNAAGALCYLLGFISGILFLVVPPYNQNRNVRFHAFQSIFFHLSWVIAWIAVTIVTLPLNALPILGPMLSVLFHFALWAGGVIVWIYLMFKTYNGQKIVLPIIGPLAEKQAGV